MGRDAANVRLHEAIAQGIDVGLLLLRVLLLLLLLLLLMVVVVVLLLLLLLLRCRWRRWHLLLVDGAGRAVRNVAVGVDGYRLTRRVVVVVHRNTRHAVIPGRGRL